MNNIYNYKFSKIGTNPSKYLNNYELYINNYLKGTKFIQKDLNLYLDDIVVFSSNSEATIRQNIDSWIWMGFLIRTNNNELIKVIDTKDSTWLKERIKFSLLIEDESKLVNQHRSTIIIKLLFLDNKDNLKSNLLNVTYEEIKKECGKFEQVLINDKEYINILKLLWGSGK